MKTLKIDKTKLLHETICLYYHDFINTYIQFNKDKFSTFGYE